MAHPIELGLVLEGEDAIEFLEDLRNPKATKEQIKMFKEAIKIAKEHPVEFWWDRILNDFLNNDALTSQDVLISRTYLCYRGESLVGFLTLVTDTIEVKLVEASDGVDGYQYSRYPSFVE